MDVRYLKTALAITSLSVLAGTAGCRGRKTDQRSGEQSQPSATTANTEPAAATSEVPAKTADAPKNSAPSNNDTGVVKASTENTTTEPAKLKSIADLLGAGNASSEYDLFGAPRSCPPDTNCGVKNVRSDNKGYWGDSQIWLRFLDSKTQAQLNNRQGFLEIRDRTNTSVVWRADFTTDGTGLYVTPKLNGARNLPFKACLRGSYLAVQDGKLVAYNYAGRNLCIQGTTTLDGKDTIADHIQIDAPAAATINMAEVVDTGSYCPPDPMLQSQADLSLDLPFPYNLLKKLGVCRNLDSRLAGQVLSSADGSPIANAEVTIDLAPGQAVNFHEVVFTDANGRFDSKSYTRMRGKTFRACVRAADFGSRCMDVASPTNDVDSFMYTGRAGPGPIRLIPNKDPVGQLSASGGDALNIFPLATTVTGWAYDPDYTTPMEVIVWNPTTGTLIKLNADQPSDGPCTQINVCDRPNTGFSFDLGSLNLPVGTHSIYFAMVNKPTAGQTAVDTRLALFPTLSPITVIGKPPPANALSRPLPKNRKNLVVIGEEEGGGGTLNVVDPFSGQVLAASKPFGNFSGSVRVAIDDVNNDGVLDVIAAPGPGRPTQVIVFDGATGLPIQTIAPFGDGFSGGAYVSSGDVNSDGKPDIVVGAGKGIAPEMKVFDSTGALIRTTMVYEPTFQEGVRVSVGDFNGDGAADIVASAPPGGGPRVRIISGADGNTISDGFVYEDTFRGGVWAVAADVDGDHKPELIVGADVGGGPRLRVLRVPDYSALIDTFVYEDTFRGGVRIAGIDIDGDGLSEIACAPGPGGGPRIRILNGQTANSKAGAPDFFAFDPNLRNGFYIAGPSRTK